VYAFLIGLILSAAWITNALAAEAPSYSSLKQAFSEATDPLTLEVIAEFDTEKTNGPRTTQNRWSECQIYHQEGGHNSFTLDFQSPLPNGIGFDDILVVDGRLYHATQFSGGFAETFYRKGLPIHFPNQQSIVIERPDYCEGCTLSWEFRAMDSSLYFYERAYRKSDDGSEDLNENYGFCQLILPDPR
jgi:hypothetical protein